MSRFISKSAERALPFFKILKKAGPMEWTPEAEAALQDLKKYLLSTPVLVATKPQESLLLYLAATNQVVSATLVAQREVDEETTAAIVSMVGGPEPSPAGLGPGRTESPAGLGLGKTESPAGLGPGKTGASTTGPARPGEVAQRKKMVQHPIYFVSSLLQGARSRYSGVQKLLFGLLMASRKLRHYFQAHEITMVTRLSLQRILHNPDATGRIVEWALELSSFGLKFESTSTIQIRVLAEFVAEWTSTPHEEVQETTDTSPTYL